MRDFVTFATPMLVLGIFYCMYRTAILFAAWRPAAAVVWSTDYSEAQQSDDLWGFGFRRGWRLGDSRNGRLIEETVHYQDADGERHVAEVKRYVRAGWRPSGTHVIWYDTADPDKATAFGPFYWLTSGFGLGVALVLLLSTAMQMH